MKLALKAAPGWRRAAGSCGQADGQGSLRGCLLSMCCVVLLRALPTPSTSLSSLGDRSLTVPYYEHGKRDYTGKGGRETVENGYLREGVWSGKFTGVMVCTVPASRSGPGEGMVLQSL